uniref:Coiled-coil domain-containing protein 102A-like n=1 Tax=Mesocestoides corti TaxID=53468 RepID=A0A5K3FC66_MESCO
MMWTQGMPFGANTLFHRDGTNNKPMHSNQLVLSHRHPIGNDMLEATGMDSYPTDELRQDQRHLHCRGRDRDLIELRARCSQLEKTVSWWSDCTTSWREKWSCVRDERNQLREELRRTKLALAALQRQNEEILNRLQQLALEIPENSTVVSNEQGAARLGIHQKSQAEALQLGNYELSPRPRTLADRLAKDHDHRNHHSRSSGCSSSYQSGCHTVSSTSLSSSHTSDRVQPPRRDHRSENKSWSV